MLYSAEFTFKDLHLHFRLQFVECLRRDQLKWPNIENKMKLDTFTIRPNARGVILLTA